MECFAQGLRPNPEISRGAIIDEFLRLAGTGPYAYASRD
jgi:hypothetical protein